MVFPYHLYYRVNFCEPLCLLFISLCAVGVCGWQAFRCFRCSTDYRYLVSNVVILVIAIFFLYLSISSLSQGGIYLLKETDRDAVSACGHIEDIVQHTGFNMHKYYYQGATELSYEVRIDGESYFVISPTNYAVGDYVEFTYLPLSGFVLSIYPK